MTVFRSDFDDDNLSWSEKYRLIAEDWCDKEAAATLLEDTKSAMMAQWQVELGDIPVNRAEQTVKASKRWLDFITQSVEARKEANLAKVNMEVIRMKSMEYQTKEANQRTELRILGR